MRARRLSSRRKSPPQTNTPQRAGRIQVGSPMRTLVATAPPSRPVIRIAPRNRVRGIRYTTVQQTSMMPTGRTVDGGNPACWNPSITDGNCINFTIAPNSTSSAGKAVSTRPVHSIFFEDCVMTGSSSELSDGASAVEFHGRLGPAGCFGKRDERTQPRLASIEPAPHQNPDVDRKQHLAEQ